MSTVPSAPRVTNRPGIAWPQPVLTGLYAAYPSTAATLPAGVRPGQCELCTDDDAHDVIVPVVHFLSGDLIEAHPNCAVVRGYVPAGAL